MGKENGSGESRLLLEDHQHFSESLWRNDEIGEKRFSFFVSLAAAVVAGLVALYGEGSPGQSANPLENIASDTLLIMRVAAGGLFVLGIMTYLRMLQRNRVTGEYLDTLKYIRRALVELGEAPADYKVPQIRRRRQPFRAGLAEAMALLCGMLLALFLMLMKLQPYYLAAVAGVLLFLVFALIAHYRR